MKKLALLQNDLNNTFYAIKTTKAMFDKDLAKIYKLKVKQINKAFKNCQNKFPSDFYFKLSIKNCDDLRTKLKAANPLAKRTKAIK